MSTAHSTGFRIGGGLSSFLNASRWIAALLVVISHVKYLLFVDFASAGPLGPAVKGLYFLGGFGHEAVVVFFVLSGFLVGGITQDRWARSGVDLVDYAIHRFARIYTVLVPALLVGFALDQIGLAWLNASELYTNSAKLHTISLNFVFAENLAATTLLGNLLMLANVKVPVLGSNTPLWSLSNEWWYYCLFGLLAAAPRLQRREGLLAALVALLLAIMLPGDLLLWGLIWLVGVAAYMVCRRLDRRMPWLLGLAVLCGTLVFLRLTHNQDNVPHEQSLASKFGRDALLAVAYAISIVSMSGLRKAWPLDRFHRWAADFSFTLYLVHFPMMIFIAALSSQVFGYRLVRVPDGAGLLMYAFLVVGLCAYAYAISLVTERHTEVLRALLARRWSIRTARPDFRQTH